MVGFGTSMSAKLVVSGEFRHDYHEDWRIITTMKSSGISDPEAPYGVAIQLWADGDSEIAPCKHRAASRAFEPWCVPG